jgi:diaminohydroxyphosphoribosylaminopyrimidine deaminase/5-amino-6-(5-phosphoribosylamino)uracil reductase
VVIGARDVNPRIGQRSLRQLRRAKIETSVGVCAAEARQLVAPFSKLMHVRRPWVILKWAQSVDGKIATTTGDSKWITDEAMRAHVHRIRGLVDAIAVGVRTVERDDPLLTCREGRPRRIAQRIVLDSALRISPRARLVQTAREVPTWIFCRRGAETARRQRLEKAGCRVTEVAAERRPQVGLSPAGVLDVLGAEEMTNVVVEGGGLLLGAFFDQRLADEVHIYMAPRLLGGAAATGALHGRGSATVSESVVLPEAARMKRLGRGWLLQAVLASGGTDAR